MASEHHSASEILALLGSQWGKIQDSTSAGQIGRLIELATQQAQEEEQQPTGCATSLQQEGDCVRRGFTSHFAETRFLGF